MNTTGLSKRHDNILKMKPVGIDSFCRSISHNSKIVIELPSDTPVEADDDLFLEGLAVKVAGEKEKKVVSEEYGNIIDYAVRALGLRTIYKYKRQYQVLRDFFMLRCPVCNGKEMDVWNMTEEEIEREVLMRLDMKSEKLVCDGCGHTVDRMKYRDLVLCVGMRSGKTVTAAIIAAYIFYLIFVVPKLDRRFQLIPDQSLRVSMVSTSSSQTEKTVWSAFTSLLENAIDEDIKRIVRNNSNYVEIDTNTKEWKVENIEFMSLHSNSGSLAGGTGILAVLEEFSRFNLGTSKRSADEVRNVLDRSLATTRSVAKTYLEDLFTLMVVISSPYYVVDDPTMMLFYDVGESGVINVKYGRHIKGELLAYHYPTWEFNPFIDRGASFIERAYSLDAAAAERDYGANPVSSAGGLFENVESIYEKIFLDTDDGIIFNVYPKREGDLVALTAKVESIKNCFAKEYYVHIDLGLNHDLLTMVFARPEDGNVYVDGMLVIKSEHNIEAYIDTPIEIIESIKDRVKINYVSYDRWQSVPGIQRLKRMMIPAGLFSVRDDAIVTLKFMMMAGKVYILDNDKNATTILKHEMRSVRRVNGKLTHTDLLVSVSGAVKNAFTGVTKKMYTKGRNVVSHVTDYKNFMPRTAKIGRL